MSRYRVVVQFDSERSVFLARAPELEHCSGEGATRAEAVAKVEEEIDAQLRNMREQGGGAPPAALDGDGGAEAGDLALKLSRTLNRELLWQARLEGIEVAQLATEILAAGLETRKGTRARRSGNEAQPQGEDGNRQPRRDDRGPPQNDRRGFQGGNNRGGGAGGGRYHAIMDDRATFVEYVRGLEGGGGRGPGGGGQGGPGGGGGGGGGRRGPGGPGGGGGRGRGRSGGGQGGGGGGGQGEGGGGADEGGGNQAPK